MKSVNIEKPCHEDWGKMAPSEKGAFCDSCQIDVFDFSKRSKDEIKSILLANKGKHICGRFKKSQLVELNTDYTTWENQSTSIFQSKFLYACLLVFGMTLFTGCIEDDELMGQMAYAEQNVTIEQSDAFYQEDVTAINDSDHKKGKIKYIPEDTVKTSCGGTEELHIKGEIGPVSWISGDTIVDQIKDLTTPIDPIGPPDSLDTWEYFEMGDIEVDPSFYEHLIDTISTKTPVDSIEVENTADSVQTPTNLADPSAHAGTNVIASKNLTISVFPNPTADVAAIVLNVPKSDLFEIKLLDLSGRQLQDIYAGIIPKGIKRFEIELSTYESGTFIVVINSNSASQTVKVQKVL
ncbi:T9SS type A sorting domain-containing protein [Crocinitomix catalasitica]|nr:T9SS type A sorting domain-containing protein [Crocinitomix catalasitica]